MPGQMPRSKDHDRTRLRKARLKELSLLPATRKKRPSDPEEAKQWLRDVADHLSRLPYAGPRFRFVASAIETYLADTKNHNLLEELCLIPSPRAKTKGQPKFSIDTTASVIEMLCAGQSVKRISTALDVKESRVKLVRGNINRLLGVRQHGAKPDGISIEDARKYAASLPQKELIAMLSATISAQDILPG